MSTKKSTQKTLSVDDVNSPISQGSYGIKYVPLNLAGKKALIDLKQWIAKQTGKSLTYNATIIYLRDFLLKTNEGDNNMTKEQLKQYLDSLKTKNEKEPKQH